jgi:hypothetical protein
VSAVSCRWGRVEEPLESGARYAPRTAELDGRELATRHECVDVLPAYAEGVGGLVGGVGEALNRRDDGVAKFGIRVRLQRQRTLLGVSSSERKFRRSRFG